MKNLYFCIIFLSAVYGLSAQNFYISFQPSTGGAKIDSILVTNLTTNEEIKLTGNQSLLLPNLTTDISISQLDDHSGYFYPNPSDGDGILCFSTDKNEEIGLSVYNTSGQLLTQSKQNLTPGLHRFQVQFPFTGGYFITITKCDKPVGFKVICSGVKWQKCAIDYTGSESTVSLKSTVIGAALNYAEGDILLFSVFSGKFNTIITDSPSGKKVYTVEFHECIDAEKNSYSIVKIGDQWWMAENLKTTKYNDGTAILNIPGERDFASGSTGIYRWYNNDEATYKNKYGAMYNWNAVNTGKLCPTGWHVPSDAEWLQLEIALGMTSDQLFGDPYLPRGTDQGIQLKATSGWNEWEGKNGNGINSSGFSALPAGESGWYGEFGGVGKITDWYASEEGMARSVNSGDAGMYRAVYPKQCGFSERCLKD